jgi:hypothetical protein
LHKYSSSSQIMGWVRLIIEKITEWARSILHEGNRLKKNLYAAKSIMKPPSLGYRKLIYIQTSACCTIFKIQSWPSVEHMSMLVINLELTGKELFSDIENLNTSQSHIDFKWYSCHQRLLSTWHDMILFTWCGGWSDSALF